MKRIELLKELSFGAEVAEYETNELENYFVETDQWAKISKGEIDIVRGEKGAGKSAIYSLLMKKVDEFFDRSVLMIAAENPRGDTVFKDLISDPPTTEVEFIVLWKLYIISIIAHRLRDFGIKNQHAEKVYKALEDARMLEREFSLAGLLRTVQDYARRILKAEALEGGLAFDPATQMPNGVVGRIVLREPSSEQRNLGAMSVDNLFAELNAALAEWKFKVWVLLDRLDIAFIDNHELEANALRALFRVYAAIQGLDNISLKIFLREDIWKRITEHGFREASHLTKRVVLDWNDATLLNLIMRRLLNNKVLLGELNIDGNSVLQDFKQQEQLFDRVFPRQVEQGPQKAKTFKWMVTRCADGTRKTAPRELIQLLNCIKDAEIKRLETGGTPTQDDQLFDRSVFKAALPRVSETRLNTYLYAEYPNERQYIEKLDREKSEQTPETLAQIWKLTQAEAIAEAEKLVELGFFERHGTREEPTYWVPFLYRDGLHLVQGRAQEDE